MLSACKDGRKRDYNVHSFSAAEKRFVYQLFNEEYLWYDQVPQHIDTSSLSSPQSMVNALRVNPPDQWSFSFTMDDYIQFANQETTGFGFAYDERNLTIFMVYIDSPAYGKLKRGDKILKVNGEEANPFLIMQVAHLPQSNTTFRVLRDGNELDITLKPAKYNYKVSLDHILNHNGKKIGYLRYDSFSENSVNEIEQHFTHFKNAAIDALVIDLRYNGGGDLTVASTLLDNITAAHPGERQFFLDWNDKMQRHNSEYYFQKTSDQDGNELSMTRIFFLVTPNSASASEAVINALVPYFGRSNVITIGDYTHGKPVGMQGREYHKHLYFLINFFVRNDDEETTQFEGIPPTCSAKDDITHAMGDPEETMLQTALYYIDHGSCPPNAQATTRRKTVAKTPTLHSVGMFGNPIL